MITFERVMTAKGILKELADELDQNFAKTSDETEREMIHKRYRTLHESIHYLGNRAMEIQCEQLLKKEEEDGGQLQNH